MNKIFIVVIALSFGFLGCSSPLDKAAEAFETGDFKVAYEEFSKRVEVTNDPNAKAYLAEMYLRGMGVPINKEKALQLGREAADENVPRGLVVFADVQSFLTDAKIPIPRDDKKAFELYERAARQEYAPAQFRLGVCYLEGYGVNINQSEALKLFEKAANSGYVIAQITMGHIYSGWVISKVQEDEKQAQEWYRKAAKQGYSFAASYVNEDDYLKKAAKRGHLDAQYILGCSLMETLWTMLYKPSISFPYFFKYMSLPRTEKMFPLLKDCIPWLEMASQQTDPKKNMVPLDYEFYQFSYSNSGIFHRRSQPSISMISDASYRLGLIYLYGLGGVKEDYEKAKVYFERAIELSPLNDDVANLQLGLMYEMEMGVSKNIEIAIEYYKKAGGYGMNRLGKIALVSDSTVAGRTPASWFADAAGIDFDNPPSFELKKLKIGENEIDIMVFRVVSNFEGIGRAQYNLGILYLKGIGGVPKDFTKAKFCFEKAAKGADPYAELMLGYLNFYGIGIPTDYAKAMSHFQQVNSYRRERGRAFSSARYYMGLMYEKGLGVDTDIDRAKSYFIDAAMKGYDPAIEKLQQLEGFINFPEKSTDERYADFLESLFTVVYPDENFSKQ